jgi:ubiquinone/menaquinone biosynthesis C-methylase UbiE/DNA-binding MarR family transcriptional regulator
MDASLPPSLDLLLNGLRAAGESTRLRLLALCAEGELTVTELTQILGQSQPRVSRHLKLLCEAGLLERHQERTWVFYRLAQPEAGARLAQSLVALLPRDDATLALDRERLAAVKGARAERAARYFRDNARRWDEIRALYVPESEVEAAVLAAFDDQPLADLLDVGTGTGRILELLAPRIERGVGIDLSHEMLELARVRIEQLGLRHCQVRHGDMYNLPFASGSFDAVVFHMVLHFADNPTAALAESARVLRPGGRLVLVDFAPHDQEFLREAHAHRRLGFAEGEVASWFRTVGLVPGRPRRLSGSPLTVVVWTADSPAAAGRAPARLKSA